MERRLCLGSLRRRVAAWRAGYACGSRALVWWAVSPGRVCMCSGSGYTHPETRSFFFLVMNTSKQPTDRPISLSLCVLGMGVGRRGVGDPPPIPCAAQAKEARTHADRPPGWLQRTRTHAHPHRSSSGLTAVRTEEEKEARASPCGVASGPRPLLRHIWGYQSTPVLPRVVPSRLALPI